MHSAVPSEPIVVTDLNHSFGTGTARIQVLFDINVQFASGKITALMGPSGSGKTTLLTLMGCLREIQDGSVKLLGQELHGASESTLISLRQRLGFIFQAHNLHESLTALQNVRMGLEVHGKENMSQYDAAASHLLTQTGTGERLNYLPTKLSGGQKQRVAVARALVGNPQIVFADEPTAALDRETGLNTVRLLKRLGEVRGTTTVMVTHDNRILELADHILRMEDGRIVSNDR
jgi:putative ABC transport system ATP-binding protein